MHMVTIILADLDERLVSQARQGAESRGGTLEEELRVLIEERAREGEADRRRRAREAMAELKRHAEQMEAQYGPFPDSTEILRQERHSW